MRSRNRITNIKSCGIIGRGTSMTYIYSDILYNRKSRMMKRTKNRPSFPEFNLFSVDAPAKLLGWNRLRQIMEINAPQLRTMTFLSIQQMQRQINWTAQVVIVETAFGPLCLCPFLDSEGYRSIMFRFDEPIKTAVEDGQHKHGRS